MLILHDVDLLPSQQHFERAYLPIWSAKNNDVIHLASAWTRYNYPTFLGGAIAIPLVLFWQIGGMPIDFFGWGGEDDALYNRLQQLCKWSWRLITFPKDPLAFQDLEMSESMSTREWKRRHPRHDWMNPNKRSQIAHDKSQSIEWNRDLGRLTRSMQSKQLTRESIHYI